MLHITYKTLESQTATVLCERITSGDCNTTLRLIKGTEMLMVGAIQIVCIKSVMTKMSKAAVKANHTRKAKPSTPEA